MQHYCAAKPSIELRSSRSFGRSGFSRGGFNSAFNRSGFFSSRSNFFYRSRSSFFYRSRSRSFNYRLNSRSGFFLLAAGRQNQKRGQRNTH